MRVRRAREGINADAYRDELYECAIKILGGIDGLITLKTKAIMYEALWWVIKINENRIDVVEEGGNEI